MQKLRSCYEITFYEHVAGQVNRDNVVSNGMNVALLLWLAVSSIHSSGGLRSGVNPAVMADVFALPNRRSAAIWQKKMPKLVHSRHYNICGMIQIETQIENCK
jgi:hypothetical protein